MGEPRELENLVDLAVEKSDGNLPSTQVGIGHQPDSMYKRLPVRRQESAVAQPASLEGENYEVNPKGNRGGEEPDKKCSANLRDVCGAEKQTPGNQCRTGRIIGGSSIEINNYEYPLGAEETKNKYGANLRQGC